MIACPHCKARSSWVVDKRNGDGYVRRRRQCDDCGERFTSFETTWAPHQMRWAKKNGAAHVAKWRAANPEKAAEIRLREKMKRAGVSA
jgi:transcriptional regulator NrdR family protein